VLTTLLSFTGNLEVLLGISHDNDYYATGGLAVSAVSEPIDSVTRQAATPAQPLLDRHSLSLR
jgi:hypothetical protein